ncbi:hypothetical protein GCM10007276_12880 [Agaricicola taiwanensis]|uniref:DUF2267 domain-containing protein n=1 Tax=Agaricicola taiwanensis TaxID=591372 RepID=A0A8J2VQB1_9RHOB|nr:hypothetical protein [Agaricicola taiwanensis]GGE36853.1 hypothetical protein GCM10007276_12880 [Agaricicola taiwanensis]
MQELLERMMGNAGIDRALAEKALVIILDFLNKEAPQDAVGKLLEALPEAKPLVGQDSGGFGLGGFGAMGALNEMTAAGLSMEQVQTVTRTVIDFAREKLGEDEVGRIVGAIPGLSAFI